MIRPVNRPPHNRGNPRTGTGAEGFAVGASAVFVLLLALVEFSRVLMVARQVGNAARAGARFGIVPGRSTTNITSAATTTLTNQGIKGATVTVQVNSQNLDASTAQPQDDITVVI